VDPSGHARVSPAEHRIVWCSTSSPRFGYFKREDENQQVLVNVHTSLVTGGVFLLDVAGKEILARVFQATGSSEVPGGVLVQRRKVVEDWSRMSNEWMLIEPERVRSFRFQHWIYSGYELTQMLLRAGFSHVQLFGDFAGASYGTGAVRLIARAQKGSS
jgi:hypothetical protein